MRKQSRFKRKPRSKKSPFKSGLEVRFAELLFKHGVKAEYEAKRFEFVRIGHYTPDWRVNEVLFIETKGYFSPRNRGDLLSFREQHPGIEIYLVFSAPDNRLTSKSKTTYAEWSDRHNFRWSHINKFPLHLWKEKC